MQSGVGRVIASIRSGVSLWQLGLLLAMMLSVSATACGTPREQSKQSPTQTPRALHHVSPPKAANGRISSRLLANFALFHTPPDGISSAASRALATSLPEIRWNLARRIPVSLPGRYWLVPGAANICVIAKTPESPSPAAVCASVAQAVRHGVANTSLNPISGKRIIVGVVPTGTRVVLVRSGEVTSPVRAFNGHFVLRDSVAAPPDELTLR